MTAHEALDDLAAWLQSTAAQIDVLTKYDVKRRLRLPKKIFVSVDMLDELASKLEAAAHRVEEILHDERRRLFDGLPKGTTLAEAARIKAERGDPLAQKMLAKVDDDARLA